MSQTKDRFRRMTSCLIRASESRRDAAHEKLARVGVKEIGVMVAHGVFTGERCKPLWQISLKWISCTDSVRRFADPDKNVTVTLSIVPLLASALSSFGDI